MSLGTASRRSSGEYIALPLLLTGVDSIRCFDSSFVHAIAPSGPKALLRVRCGHFAHLLPQRARPNTHFGSQPGNGARRTGTITACGIVVGNPLSRMIGNFFIGLNRTPVPTRLFGSQAMAAAWLRPSSSKAA